MNRYDDTARRLKEARREQGLTQGELAKIARQHGHLTASAISNYEQGIRVPSPEAAAVLEIVLGLPAAYWMGLVSKREAQLIQTLRDSQ